MIYIDDYLFGDKAFQGANIKIENYSSYTKSFEIGKQYIAYGKIKSDYLNTDTLLPIKIDQNSAFQAFDYHPIYYISNGVNDLSTIFHHD